MEFMSRLAALVPKPRVNLTRFHGVFSPNSILHGYDVRAKYANGLLMIGQVSAQLAKCGGPLRRGFKVNASLYCQSHHLKALRTGVA